MRIFLERKVGCFVVMGRPAIRSYGGCLSASRATTRDCPYPYRHHTTSIRAILDGLSPFSTDFCGSYFNKTLAEISNMYEIHL